MANNMAGEKQECKTSSGEDLVVWEIIMGSPKVPFTKNDKGNYTIPKKRDEYNDEDIKAIRKNAKTQKLLICGIEPDKYISISSYQGSEDDSDAAHIIEIKNSYEDLHTPYEMTVDAYTSLE
ncbi:hypothetical protein HAX54_007986 [Datura stramonium]|uniref:Uncharacterized protein n=1 Tax=Datura stramonium TaxID=4076 RepID=A0ABS8TEZ0_DATST|nr:hypothetical protein [Datura stramonium]